jgi:hypothetical protein
MPFTCPECGRLFKTQAVLDSHRLSHLSSVPSPQAQPSAEQSIEEFLKAGILAKQDVKDLTFAALEKYKDETFQGVTSKISDIKKSLEPKPVVSSPPTQLTESTNPPAHHTIIHQTKKAFTRFKDYNIMLVFGTQVEKYYTDLPSEVLEEMRQAALNSIVNVIKQHKEFDLFIEE